MLARNLPRLQRLLRLWPLRHVHCLLNHPPPPCMSRGDWQMVPPTLAAAPLSLAVCDQYASHTAGTGALLQVDAASVRGLGCRIREPRNAGAVHRHGGGLGRLRQCGFAMRRLRQCGFCDAAAGMLQNAGPVPRCWDELRGAMDGCCVGQTSRFKYAMYGGTCPCISLPCGERCRHLRHPCDPAVLATDADAGAAAPHGAARRPGGGEHGRACARAAAAPLAAGEPT